MHIFTHIRQQSLIFPFEDSKVIITAVKLKYESIVQKQLHIVSPSYLVDRHLVTNSRFGKPLKDLKSRRDLLEISEVWMWSVSVVGEIETQRTCSLPRRHG